MPERTLRWTQFIGSTLYQGEEALQTFGKYCSCSCGKRTGLREMWRVCKEMSGRCNIHR